MKTLVARALLRAHGDLGSGFDFWCVLCIVEESHGPPRAENDDAVRRWYAFRRTWRTRPS